MVRPKVCPTATQWHWCDLKQSPSLPAVCVRNAAGTAASCPAPAFAWPPVTRTTSRSTAAVIHSWATASTCSPGRQEVCSASRRRTCPAGAPGSPAPSRSLSAWGILLSICSEVGELVMLGSGCWCLSTGWVFGTFPSLSLSFRQSGDSKWDAGCSAEVLRWQWSDSWESRPVCLAIVPARRHTALGRRYWNTWASVQYFSYCKYSFSPFLKVDVSI